MPNIDKIDENFKIETKIEKEGIRFYDSSEAPFVCYGLIREGGIFRRMPAAVAERVSAGVNSLHTNTAGGRVRFRTDSPYIAIHVKCGWLSNFMHCARSGLAGFDLYFGERHVKTFMPPPDAQPSYESIAEFGGSQMREVTINFPTYSNILDLYIGLDENAKIEAPAPYAVETPVVYYGSSITQGGCASRPGSIYQNIVSRRFNCDYVNLGFSGSAKGEDAMADYIAGLSMSLFVYDYDHNAPSPEYLRDTHEKMFKKIRNAHPDIPIIMMSRPVYNLSYSDRARLEVIRTTYENALAAGDKNVYLLDGPTLTALCEDEGTVDRCHPTDLGFASMAKALCDLIEREEIFVPVGKKIF